MANLAIGPAFQGILSKLGEHKAHIDAAKTVADQALAAATGSVQQIHLPDGTPLVNANGVVTIPAAALTGVSVDQSSGLVQVVPGQPAATSSPTVLAAIAGPNIVQPL